MLFNFLQTGIAQAAPVQQEMSYSLFEMAVKGGWLMMVLLLLSFVAIYIFGKKWWIIRQAGKIDKDFMNDIRDYIHEGKIKSARTLCSKYDAPVARMVEAGIARIGRPATDVQAAIENVGNVEVARLEKGGNNIDITLLSSGIYTAMITTVGGLIVGILAYFGYNFLTARISSLVYSMESATIKFMDMLGEPAAEANNEE